MSAPKRIWVDEDFNGGWVTWAFKDEYFKDGADKGGAKAYRSDDEYQALIAERDTLVNRVTVLEGALKENISLAGAQKLLRSL